MSVLLIDNYDSFAYNLVRYIRELGRSCVVLRNDAVTLEGVAELRPSHIVISPGPCTPNEAGISNAIIERFGGTVPLLGVCLGHQCIGQVFGGRVVRALKPMHGKTSLLHHRGGDVLAGLPSPFRITRYHSLVVAAEDLPECLEATALSDEGEIMALRHRHLPIFGVQFHPEAVLTEHGHALLENFLRIDAARWPRGYAQGNARTNGGGKAA